MPKNELPDDLVEFLGSDRRLKYDPSACEIGVFTFRTLEEIEEIELIVRAEDHKSTYPIRGLDLVKSCEEYDPRGMLVYIPSLRKYGSYDSELEVLITYRGMSWSDFLADPARYINAAWDFDPEIAEATFSEAAADRVVEVYSAANGLEAHGLRMILEERGIRAEVVGEELQTGAGDLPLGQTLAPRIWVREGDAGRARDHRGVYNPSRPEGDESADRAEADGTDDVTFPCDECGKGVTFPGRRRGHVETCPHCGSYVDVPDAAKGPPPAKPALTAFNLLSRKAKQANSPESGSRTTAQLWIEVFAVLALAYVMALFSAITAITGWLPEHRSPFTYHMAYLIVRSLQVAAPVLVIMALCGDSWQTFGIVRPRWIIDALGACAIWLVAMMARQFVMSFLPRSMLGGLASVHAAHFAGSEGIAGFLLLLVACGAGGFAEELVMRAYLIPRLERLLSSTWFAVVVTTTLFASYHIYQGTAGTISAAASGLVYAIAFCWSRRLWPVCLAHALHNILAYL